MKESMESELSAWVPGEPTLTFLCSVMYLFEETSKCCEAGC